MPRDSRASELWTLVRRFDGHGEHPAAWAENVDELLGGSFDLDVKLVESSASYEPEEADEAWSSGPLAGLDASRRAAVWDEFVSILRRYEGRPKSYVLVLGRRR
jgi:hypothetical protein